MWNFAEEERDIYYLYHCIYIWGFYSASCSRMALLLLTTGIHSGEHVHSGLVVKIFWSPTEGWEHTHSIFPKVFKEEYILIFFGGLDSKPSACNARDLGLIPGSGRSPGEGNGNPPKYSCLENPMARGAWFATVHGVAKSQTRLSD